jgi:HSP20 family protein
MAEASKVPAKTGQSGMPQAWQPFESLRREMDRLFDDFGLGTWRTPFRRSLADFQRLSTPPVDIVEKDNAYEVTADVPGFDEKDIEVKLVNGALCIKGERKSEKEEKKEDYYLSEREFGSFERRFELPEEVDADKIEASLKKGVLTVTLPKKPEAQKPAKKIEVKPAG